MLRVAVPRLLSARANTLKSERSLAAFTRKKKEKRSHELANKQENGNAQPTALETLDEVTRFLRKIGVPDQHELGKADVSPEYRESEHVLSKIVKMIVVHNAFEFAF